MKDIAKPIYTKMGKKCNPGRRKQHSFPIECQVNMGLLQASQNLYPYPCLDIPITHHHGNQGFLTGTLNIIKTQKEEKIAKIQIAPG